VESTVAGADALLEHRNSLPGSQVVGHLLTQLGTTTAVAGVVIAGCALAGITTPPVPAPDGVHVVIEMVAAAAATICFFAVV
jgi:hypothetical protein